MALVQATGTFALTSGTNIARAFASNVTAGNLLVCVNINIILASNTFSVTDTQGNLWNSATAQAVSTGGSNFYKVQIFWAKAGATGANTVTAARSGSASTDERVIMIAEFDSISAATPTDVSNTGSGTTANPSINLAGVSSAAVLAVAGAPTSGTLAAGAGWTDLGNQDGNDGEFKLNPGSGTVAAPFVGAASEWSEAVASFIAAVGVSGQSSASGPSRVGMFTPQMRSDGWF